MARVSRAQKQFFGHGLTYDINMDEVVNALVAGHAMTHSLEDMGYVDAIMDTAFEEADNAFNLEADAVAAAGGIKHMYEWGTVGVHKGRSNVRRQLGSPQARLWHNFTEGRGLNRTIWYAFKPSVANVPKPTVAQSGMNSETIKALRDHVFVWKSRVIEMGETVVIKPKRKFLLIPMTEKNKPYMRPHDRKRGYTMTPDPVRAQPGFETAGSFTKLWLHFWNNDGEDMLQENTTKMILEDYEPEFVSKRTSKTLKPIGTFNVNQKVKVDSKKMQAKITARRKNRRRGGFPG